MHIAIANEMYMHDIKSHTHSCSNLIGQLEVPYFAYRPPERSYEYGLPRAKKDAKHNSSLVPRSNTMITIAILF